MQAVATDGALHRFVDDALGMPPSLSIGGHKVPLVHLDRCDSGRGGRCSYALVIRHASRRFAIALEALYGVVVANDTEFVEMSGTAPAAGQRQCYRGADGHREFSLIDLDTLAERFSTGVEVENTGSEMKIGSETPLSGHVVFHSGGGVYGLAIETVSRVETWPPVLETPLCHPFIEGFHGFRGYNQPVANLLDLLRSGATTEEPGERKILLLRHERYSLALLVGSILGIERVQASQIKPLPASGDNPGGFLAGVFQGREYGTISVLSPEVLVGRVGWVDAEFSTSAQEGERKQEDRGEGTVADQASQFLVFTVSGFTLAARLIDFEAVIALPADFVSDDPNGGSVAGSCMRMGKKVAVLDMGLLLGAHPVAHLRPGSPLLCVATEAGSIGFAVDSIDRLQTARTTPLPCRDLRIHGLVPAFTSMIRVRAAAVDRAACVIDMSGLSRTVAASLDLDRSRQMAGEPPPIRPHVVAL